MKIAKIGFEDKESWFLLVNAGALPKEIRVSRQGCAVSGGHPSSRLFGFCQDGNALVKLRREKYLPSRNPLAWFFRVLIRDRILFQFESRKERTGGRRLAAAGLKVARNLGWGLSVNPFNEWLSVYICAVEKAKTVHQVFQDSGPRRRQEIVEKIADELARCVGRGFVIKDPSFNNILVDAEGELIWVDTETKRFFSRKRAVRELDRILSERCRRNSDFYPESLLLRELTLRACTCTGRAESEPTEPDQKGRMV